MLTRLLSIPAVYELFQRAVGAHSSRSTYVRDHVRPQEGELVLDIGCGPGDILPHLPAGVQYHGLDHSAAYISAAKQRYGERGLFEVKDVADLVAEQPSSYDVIMANGVLHHLDDETVGHVLRTARLLLKPGGRWVSFDGCYTPGQSRVAKMLLDRDRGRHIRTEPQYLALIRRSFPTAKAVLRHDLLRIPYTHIILEATCEMLSHPAGGGMS